MADRIITLSVLILTSVSGYQEALTWLQPPSLLPSLQTRLNVFNPMVGSWAFLGPSLLLSNCKLRSPHFLTLVSSSHEWENNTYLIKVLPGLTQYSREI